nr:RNA-directed DNA polymerase, eukaryota [Tanacetum cinerariifolium]
MSLYKAPKVVLTTMETIRRKFFYGIQGGDKKITWVKWSKILAAKKYGGLGVSSFFALNRALLFRWVWRFVSQDDSLWYRVISSIHGSCFPQSLPQSSSVWSSLSVKFTSSNCKELIYFLTFVVYTLEANRDVFVAEKLTASIDGSFRRSARGGVEEQQFVQLQNLVDLCVLSSVSDRWVWSLSGDGLFRVKDARNLLDENFLPKSNNATRWVKFIPIKVNVFAWKVSMDRLPTRMNLLKRDVFVPYSFCPICKEAAEDSSHLFFTCELAVEVSRPKTLGKMFSLTILFPVLICGVMLDVVVRLVGRFLRTHDPQEPHLAVLKRILCCPTTRRSTLGYCVLLGNNFLSWSSMRHYTLSRSSVEVEYFGVANWWLRLSRCEIFFERSILLYIRLPLFTLIMLAQYIYLPCGYHQRTKHIEIDIHFVRYQVATIGQVRVLHVPLRYQYVDIFTRGLSSPLFDENRASLSVMCPPTSTARGCKVAVSGLLFRCQHILYWAKRI